MPVSGLLRGGEDVRASGFMNSEDEDVEVELTLDMEMANIASKDVDFQDALIDFKDAVACDVAHAVSGRRDKVHVLSIHAGMHVYMCVCVCVCITNMHK